MQYSLMFQSIHNIDGSSCFASSSCHFQYTKSAFNDFKKLPKKVRKRIIGVLLKIRTNPWKYCKKLVGTRFYRIRAGDYRIIVQINKKIYVLKIAHRKHIYKMF